MTDFPSYAYGTVTVAANGTTVTGADTLWSGVNARAGDDITIDGHTVIIVDVTDETTLTIDAWPYDAVTGGDYKITQRSPLRFVGGIARADLTQLLATLKAKGLMWYLDPAYTAPDDAKPPLTADEGQVIQRIATGETWVMQSGAWVSVGVFKALSIKGAWSSATSYNVGDVVSLNGTSYVAVASSTNQSPPNATYWAVLAAKGDTGATGPTGPGYGGTSTTSLAIGTGSKAFTTQAGLAYTNGARVRASSAANTSNWMEGLVTYSGTTLTMTADKINGSGTFADWNFNLAGAPGAGDMSSTNYGAEYSSNTALFAANLSVPQYQLKKVGVDFNTVTDDGFYITDASCSNLPDTSSQWYVHVSRYENANSVLQKAYKLWPGDTSEEWVRNKFVSNGWNDWRRVDSQREYVGFYNGYSPSTTPANTYNIGVATATNPLAFGRVSVLAPVWNDAGTYQDSSGRINPQPIRVGNEIWVYYEGFDGTRKSIFMLRTDLKGNLREKPLLPVILYSSVASATSIGRPAVLYDPADTTWPFKMVFTRALSGTVTTSLMSAHSKDGIAWTVIGEIHNIASGASWENTLLETTGRLMKDGSTYRLLYSGHNGTSWRSGEMHSTDFATWTRNSANPMLSPRGGYLQALTANVVVGSKTLKVANSALFDVGAPIAICENGSGSSYQMNRIAAIPDSTTLTTLYAIEGNYTTALTSCVSQMHSRSVELSEVWFENGVYRALIVCFQFVKNGVLVETMGYAESPDMNTAFTIKPAEWPLPMIEKQKVWDQVSAENLKFIRLR